MLLESEDNQCPDCKEKDTSPETLIPNRFLRNAVNNFRNKTGYKGGGQRVKRNEAACSKSPAIGMNPDISYKLNGSCVVFVSFLRIANYRVRYQFNREKESPKPIKCTRNSWQTIETCIELFMSYVVNCL